MSLPGLDNFGDLEPDTTILERLHLYKNRFLLFSGAPAQIRGSQMAIRLLIISPINCLILD